MTLAQRVTARFVLASGTAEQKKRLQVLEDELEALEGLQDDLEDFVFMEETATKLMVKARELAQKLPDLVELNRQVHSGLMAYHNSVLNDLSAALDELDEAVGRRTDEKDDLHELGAR